MTKLFTNDKGVLNLYKKKSTKSEVMTQLIYGENFFILNKSPKWLKIKIKDDGYKGFVINRKFKNLLKPTHKVSVLKANIYKYANKKKKISELSFNSKLKVTEKKNRFVKFDNKWIETKNIKKLNFKNYDVFKNVKIFRNVKYKWGGKTF